MELNCYGKKRRSNLTLDVIQYEKDEEFVKVEFNSWMKKLKYIAKLSRSIKQLTKSISERNTGQTNIKKLQKKRDEQLLIRKNVMTKLIQSVKKNSIYVLNKDSFFDGNLPLHRFENSINGTELLVFLGHFIVNRLEVKIDDIIFWNFCKTTPDQIYDLLSQRKGKGLIELQLTIIIRFLLSEQYCHVLIMTLSESQVLPLIDNFEFTINNQSVTVTDELLYSFFYSEVLLHAYSLLLRKKEYAVKTEVIKKYIQHIIDNNKIFIVPYLFSLGITAENGFIYIRTINLENVFDLQSSALVFITLIHEVSHFIMRKVMNTNYFEKSRKLDSFPSKYDTGDTFEALLFGNKSKINDEFATFILNKNNYNQSYELFTNKINNIKNDNNEGLDFYDINTCGTPAFMSYK